MFKHGPSGRKYLYSFLISLVFHAAIFSFIKMRPVDFSFLRHLDKTPLAPVKVFEIKTIDPLEVQKLKTVGIKDGKKNADRPDIPSPPPPQPPPLSLENLGASAHPTETPTKKQVKALPKAPVAAPSLNSSLESKGDDSGRFYFRYKNQGAIPYSAEQENLKSQALKNSSVPFNKATQKISNFEIRYERPEGVSEDELNSDEKAYYSFYVRSYQNYFSKIYSNYERIVVERPGLAKVFDQKHLLIGKIDYDENGNIITVKILKSSESDDLHYFFEETLKQLSQPNPPKIFTRNKKEFSIYYQLQIN